MPNIRRNFPGKTVAAAAESSDDEEEEDHVVYRGSGKQLGGKYLRPSAPDSEEDEDEEEPQRIYRPGGGKQLGKALRPPPMESDSDDDDEELEDDDDDDEPVRVVHRGGGKNLVRHDDVRIEGGGKMLSRMQASSDEEQVVRPAGRGKQLRRPEEEPQVVPSPAGGKQLRRPEPAATVVRSPAGGKQLRRPEPAATVVRSPAGGKQLRRPDDDEDEEEEVKPVVKPVSRGKQTGKQLRRAVESEEEESDEDFGDDDDDEEESEEEEDYEETFVPKPSTRPKRASASKPKIVDDNIGDAEIDEQEELDINNVDMLYEDEDDRKKLEALPEFEREAILGERFEKLKMEQDMRKAMKEARKNEEGKSATAAKPPAKKAAKKAAAAPRRESTRDKDAKGVKSRKAAALMELKKEKKLQKKRREESDDSELDYGSDSDEDSDEDYDEAMPWRQGAQQKKTTTSRLDRAKVEEDSDAEMEDATPSKEQSSRQDIEAMLEDFVKVTVPRRRLARWCHEPFFNAAVLECFVRVLIGEDENGEKVYRLCQIVDVVKGIKEYAFPVTKKNTKPVRTTIQLTLEFAGKRKNFPMSLVSDADPNELDVRKYIDSNKAHRLEVLTRRQAAKLKRVQDDLVHNYRYTVEDIENKLKSRKEQGKQMGNLGLEQTKASIAVQSARDAVEEAERVAREARMVYLQGGAGDSGAKQRMDEAEATVNVAKKELEARVAEERRTLERAQDRKRKLKQRGKDRDWAKVNQRAIQMNQKADREAHIAQQQSQSSNKTNQFDPFARRRVKPKILWEVGQDDEEQKTDQPAAPVDKPVTVSDAAPKLVQEPMNVDEDETNEDVLARTTVATLLGGNKRVAPKRNRKGLSIAEYLERKEKGTLYNN